MRHARIVAAMACVLAVPQGLHAENSLKKLNDMLSSLSKGAGPKGNLVVDGGFEDPVVQKGGYSTYATGQSFGPWQVVGTGSVSPISGDYAQGGVRFNAQGGKQWLDLTGPMSNQAAGVQQTVKTEPGKRYELAFWVGNVAGGAWGTTSSVEVLVDGRSLGTAANDKNQAGQLTWGLFKMPVTATGSSMTLTFINRDPSSDNSNGLDSVSLVPVAGGATAAAAAPVMTESFESPSTQNYTTMRAGQSFSTGANTWMVQSGSIDIVNTQVRRETVAFDGTQTIDLAGSPGPGVMATTFATTPGRTYALALHYARNSGIGATPARAKLEVVGGATLLTAELAHAAPQPANGQLAYEGSFVADGAMTTLRLTSLNPGNYGMTVDGISVTPVEGQPAVASARNLSGEYVYQGSGTATVSQVGDEVHMFFTWTPQGAGPHYEAKGKLQGDTITGEWYSLLKQKGWFKLVAKVQPNGDIDLSQSEDPINANIRKTVLKRK